MSSTIHRAEKSIEADQVSPEQARRRKHLTRSILVACGATLASLVYFGHHESADNALMTRLSQPEATVQADIARGEINRDSVVTIRNTTGDSLSPYQAALDYANSGVTGEIADVISAEMGQDQYGNLLPVPADGLITIPADVALSKTPQQLDSSNK